MNPTLKAGDILSVYLLEAVKYTLGTMWFFTGLKSSATSFIARCLTRFTGKPKDKRQQ
jgi:hypothetical protein